MQGLNFKLPEEKPYLCWVTFPLSFARIAIHSRHRDKRGQSRQKLVSTQSFSRHSPTCNLWVRPGIEIRLGKAETRLIDLHIQNARELKNVEGCVTQLLRFWNRIEWGWKIYERAALWKLEITQTTFESVYIMFLAFLVYTWLIGFTKRYFPL